MLEKVFVYARLDIFRRRTEVQIILFVSRFVVNVFALHVIAYFQAKGYKTDFVCKYLYIYTNNYYWFYLFVYRIYHFICFYLYFSCLKMIVRIRFNH